MDVNGGRPNCRPCRSHFIERQLEHIEYIPKAFAGAVQLQRWISFNPPQEQRATLAPQRRTVMHAHRKNQYSATYL